MKEHITKPMKKIEEYIEDFEKEVAEKKERITNKRYIQTEAQETSFSHSYWASDFLRSALENQLREVVDTINEELSTAIHQDMSDSYVFALTELKKKLTNDTK